MRSGRFDVMAEGWHDENLGYGLLGRRRDGDFFFGVQRQGSSTDYYSTVVLVSKRKPGKTNAKHIKIDKLWKLTRFVLCNLTNSKSQ